MELIYCKNKCFSVFASVSKVFFEDDSYVICRFSGTEPLLRIMAEASTAEEAQVLLDTFRKFVEGLM